MGCRGPVAARTENIRFFQRFGIDATTAASAGVIDSVSGFVVQIVLFVGLVFWSDVDFGLSFDTGNLDGLGTIVLIVILAVLVLGVLVFAIPHGGAVPLTCSEKPGPPLRCCDRRPRWRNRSAGTFSARSSSRSPWARV